MGDEKELFPNELVDELETRIVDLEAELAAAQSDIERFETSLADLQDQLDDPLRVTPPDGVENMRFDNLVCVKTSSIQVL